MQNQNENLHGTNSKASHLNVRSNKRALMMAGGTGGHIFPALACAKTLLDAGWQVEWLGSAGGMEEEIVPKHGIQIHSLSVKGVRGNGIFRLLKAPFSIGNAYLQARTVLRTFQPIVVIGMGGFASGPGGLAAKFQRVPLMVHEQNAIPGLTNKVLAHLAHRVLQAFPHCFRQIDSKYLITTGNPIRSDFLKTPRWQVEEDRPLNLLVLGGSLGASRLNEAVPEAIKLAGAKKFIIRHQSGKRWVEQAKQAYQRADVPAQVESFIEDMPEAYQWADLVICRSGALTITELTYMGRASLLVPYPHAVDDHQSLNAEFLTAAGAAELIAQRDLSASKLAERLLYFESGRDKLVDMGKKAYTLIPKKEATQVLLAECERIAVNQGL